MSDAAGLSFDAFRDRVFAAAAGAGVEAYELFATRESSREVAVTQGEIRRYQDATEGGASLKVLRDGRSAFAFTEVYDEESARRLVDEAVDNLSSVDAEASDSVYEGRDSYPAVAEYDGAFAALEAKEQIRWAQRLEQTALDADSRITMVPVALVASMDRITRLASSAGLDLSYRTGGGYAYVSALAVDKEDRRSGEDFEAGLAPSDLDLEAVARRAAEDAASKLGASSVKSGKYGVVIERRAMASFVQMLMRMASAENVHRGLSALAGRLDSMVAADCVTITDEPVVPGSILNYPFDSQGVATRGKEVVSNGRLTTYLHSLKTAAKDGVAPTGNGFRAGYSGGEGIRPVNAVLQPGTHSYRDLLAALDSGLVVTWLSGLHAGANPASGQFSLSATGYLVEGGAVSRPVDQITVSGSFVDLFTGITTVGSDLRQARVFDYGVYTPSVLVDRLDVAGG